MGWLKALQSKTISLNSKQDRSLENCNIKAEPNVPEVSHIEDVSRISMEYEYNLPSLSFASLETLDSQLPFVPGAEIQRLDLNRRNSQNKIPRARDNVYIVIDCIVYDCTKFVREHPGGRQIIESFQGQDCSWQFWRFHSKEVMCEWGRPLRVARTEGVQNKWSERPRFVGLRGIGDTDGDGE